MKIPYIIGADLSQQFVDLACHQSKAYVKIANGRAGFKELMNWLKDQNIKPADALIVMEHTGLYSYHLEAFLHAHSIAFVKVSALEIKRSLGLVRGKNDKIDAQRIARYGYEKREVLKGDQKVEKTLERLQMLHSTRRRLVRHRASLKNALKIYKSVLGASDSIIKTHVAMIKSFDVQVKNLESEIRALIKKEEPLKTNAEMIQTITGIGEVVSTAAIVKTKNFTAFKNARKFACYCGTAPFEHSSGKSIRGKTRVSHLADKEMKTLLDQAANSAIQHDPELKAYYQRRLEAGKGKKSTINIIRNKLLYRMFAVVQRQTPFIKNYLKTA
jgi:transposase